MHPRLYGHRALGLALLLGGGVTAGAQGPPASGGAAKAASPPVSASGAPEVAADSPRAALTDFLALTRQGKYAEAAAHLDLLGGQEAQGPTLARRLKAVLDRHLWIDLESLSPRAQGDEEDGLPPGVDQVGTVPVGDHTEPVRLLRREMPEGARWVFARSTVSRVDGWYDALGDQWIRQHLPDWLLRPGPLQVLRWQWLGLPLLLALAYLLARIVAWPTQKVGAALAARTKATWDDALVARLDGLLTLFWAWVAVQALLPWLELNPPAQALADRSLRAAALIGLFAVLYRAVDVLGGELRTATWTLGNPSARSALAIAMRSAKVAVVACALVGAFIELGYPVASILAGIGIGGLGLALAAQKTVENLFGSVSLAADEAIRLGDTVRIDDMVGTVEGIGLRSTRIRTPDRTLVTIPNGLLAGMRIESLTARDRMRLVCTLGLVHGTTAAQMRQVLEACERILRTHPKVWPHELFVRFKEIGVSSLDVEVIAWFEATWDEFTLIRQEVLLQLLEAVEASGTSLAFPTRTVRVESGSAVRAGGGNREADPS